MVFDKYIVLRDLVFNFKTRAKSNDFYSWVDFHQRCPAENSLKVSFTDPDKFISSFLFQNQDWFISCLKTHLEEKKPRHKCKRMTKHSYVWSSGQSSVHHGLSVTVISMLSSHCEENLPHIHYSSVIAPHLLHY